MVQSQEKQQFLRAVMVQDHGEGSFAPLGTSHSLGSADSGHLHEGDLKTPFVRRGGGP